jgi:MFS family permease
MHAQRTLTRFYLYAALNGLQFGWTTWLAYVLLQGGNPGWAESAFHLAILLGEIPTGIVADRVGRRTSMLIGLALGAACWFSYPFIQGTITACLVLGASGLGSTFLSGADTALLYETASAVGGPDLARRAMAKASALQFAALAASPVIAGLLFEWHVLAPFLARGVLSLISLGVVWTMVDPSRRLRGAGVRATGEQHPDTGTWSHTAAAVRIILKNRAVLGIMLFTWAYNAVGSMAGQYGQAYFPYVGLTMAGAGVAYSLARLLSAGSSHLIGRASRSAARWLLYTAPAVQALGYLLMGLTRNWLGAVWFILGDGLDGVISPTLQHRLNEEIPSEQRATLLSFQNVGASLLVSAAFPAASYLQPVTTIYIVTGAAGICAGVIWAVSARAERRA